MADEPEPVRARNAKGQFLPGKAPPRPRERGPAKLPRTLKEEALKACAAIGEDGQGKDGVAGYLRTNAKLRDAIVLECVPTRPRAEVEDGVWGEADRVLARNRHGQPLVTMDEDGTLLDMHGHPLVRVINVGSVAPGAQILPGGRVVDWDTADKFHAWHQARSSKRATAEDVEAYFAAGQPSVPPLPKALRVIRGSDDGGPQAA